MLLLVPATALSGCLTLRAKAEERQSISLSLVASICFLLLKTRHTMNLTKKFIHIHFIAFFYCLVLEYISKYMKHFHSTLWEKEALELSKYLPNFQVVFHTFDHFLYLEVLSFLKFYHPALSNSLPVSKSLMALFFSHAFLMLSTE